MSDSGVRAILNLPTKRNKMNNNPKYNPNIHHRRSIRLKGYDYSQAGLYFITICIQDRKHLFGNVVNAEMILNDAGKIANDCWLDIPNYFPNANLHEHIIMPNHLHGIIELMNVGAVTVGAENFLPLHHHQQQNAFQKMIPRSIGSIVKGFKIGVTKWFRQNTHVETVWQRNYHEHIIRDEKSYETISNYIINNPAKWTGDKFFTK